jgi:hypothetical protein
MTLAAAAESPPLKISVRLARGYDTRLWLTHCRKKATLSCLQLARCCGVMTAAFFSCCCVSCLPSAAAEAEGGLLAPIPHGRLLWDPAGASSCPASLCRRAQGAAGGPRAARYWGLRCCHGWCHGTKGQRGAGPPAALPAQSSRAMRGS